MPTHSYASSCTGLLLVDPYNDFLSDGGKLHGQAESVMEAVGTLRNMRAVLAAIRAAGIQVFYVPHRRARPADFRGWDHPSPYQLGARDAQVFAEGSWGGAWHPDFVPTDDDVMIREHFGSSGFANTDLDVQLRQRGVERIVLVGMLANTCLETTAKYGVELGYHVTLIRDATAAMSPQAMHAAHEINGPTFAHAILSTDEFCRQLAAG